MTPQDAERARRWRDEVGLERALVLADPERTLYRALGARRPTPFWTLRPRVARAGVRALLAGERVGWKRGDDTLLLGADVVYDAAGRIVLLHLASDAADRVSPDELVATLAALPNASADQNGLHQ